MKAPDYKPLSAAQIELVKILAEVAVENLLADLSEEERRQKERRNEHTCKHND